MTEQEQERIDWQEVREELWPEIAESIAEYGLEQTIAWYGELATMEVASGR